jgi:hypothetical protein
MTHRKEIAMRKILAAVLAALLVVPAVASAGVTRSPRPSYVMISFSGTIAASGARLGFTVWPHDFRARLVDVVVHQYSAGTSGTSWSALARKADGASFANLSTASTLTLAAGAYAEVDAQGDLAVPAGCTAPGIVAGLEVSKGTYIDVTTTEVGSYSPHASASVVLVFAPL